MGKKMKKAQEKVVEKEVRNILIDETILETMEKEIPRMKVITPSEVSDKYGLRVSVVKCILRDLERKGLIKLVAGNKRIKIWMGMQAKEAKAAG